MIFSKPTAQQLRRRISRDLGRTDRVSAAARTDNPEQCNCCVLFNSRLPVHWRVVRVCVVRLGRYWAMGPSIVTAERLVREMKEKASW